MIFGKKRERADLRQLSIAYKRVFSSPEGREVLFDIFNRNYLLNSHGGDPLKEGRRAAALDMLHMCKIDLNEFDKLLKEEE